jgi:hypothetical protein
MTEHNLPDKDDAPWLDCMDGFGTASNHINPGRPSANSDLVERVRWVIGSAEVVDVNTPDWTEEAVAAIQEIAAWLHDHQYWENAAAVLYAELDDFRKAQ